MFESLQSEITMETRDFSRGADRAERDMTGLQKQADQTASKFESVGGRLKSLGQTFTLGVTLPLAAVGVKSLQTASEVEEMHAKMETVFQDQTADVQAWADAVAKETNRSSLQFEEMATALQDTFVPMGLARDEAADMSKEVAELAVDLSSFNDMPMDEALRRLRSGLVGNHENFREFGIVISQTALGEQLEEQFGVGVQAASEQQKMLARLQLVYQGTADAQGDAARTSDSFANQLRGLTGSLREAGVAIGQQLMPMATDIVDIIKTATNTFTGLDENLQRLIVGIGGAAAIAGPLIFALGALAAAAAAVSAPVLAIIGVVGLLGAALFAFKDDIGGATDTIATFRDMIGAAIERVRNIVGRHAGDIAESFGKIGQAIKAVIESRAFAIFADAILGLLTTVLDGVLTFVNIVLKLLTGDFRGALEEWVGVNKRAFRGFLEFIDKWTDGFASTFVNGIIRGMNRGSDAIEGFVQEIPGFADFELGTIETVDFSTADRTEDRPGLRDLPATRSDPGGAPELGRTGTGTGGGGVPGSGLSPFGGATRGTGGGQTSLATPTTPEELHELASQTSGELRPGDVGLSSEEFNRLLAGDSLTSTGGTGASTASRASDQAFRAFSTALQSAVTQFEAAVMQFDGAEITVDKQGFIRLVDGRIEQQQSHRNDRVGRQTGTPGEL